MILELLAGCSGLYLFGGLITLVHAVMKQAQIKRYQMWRKKMGYAYVDLDGWFEFKKREDLYLVPICIVLVVLGWPIYVLFEKVYG